jgi:hypothetical protein
LLCQRHFASFRTSLFLYLGTVQQVVYLLQELTQVLLLGTQSESTGSRNQPQRLESSPSAEEYRLNRNLRTEEGVRLETQERRMTEEQVEGDIAELPREDPEHFESDNL